MSRILRLLALSLVALAPACLSPEGDTPDDKRYYVRDMRDRALDDLYEARPEARGVVQGAVGYACFSNLGTKILLLATGQGYGVAVHNATGEETFMRMTEIGGGPGIGVVKARTIVVFHTEAAFEHFVAGDSWDFAGAAEAAAKTDDTGGAADGYASVISAVEVFQLTDYGLALSATLGGTKYRRDDELN